MTQEDADHTQLRETINNDVVQLIHHLRSANAPADALTEATEHIRKAMSILAPSLQQGDGWSASSIACDTPAFDWLDSDLTACMPYSPVSGRRNPVAPPISMWREGDEVAGEAFFSPTYAGPPDSVHGGLIAAVFDELLSMANVLHGVAGYTGTLTIRYHRKTPLSTPIELWSQNVRRDGRKLLCKGEMRVDGVVTASAEGLFIKAA